MRMVANEVSRRAFVRFINTTDFWFPPVPRDDLQASSPRRFDR